MPISPPVQITVPFATSGLKNPIPANTNNVTGNAGYDAGFGAINMTPKTAGGIPPFGQDFNGIFFDITTALQYLESGASFVFSSAFATAVGGYPLGALVSRTDGSGLWRNTAANNTTDPEAFGAGWQPESAGSVSIAMTNANVTLTALQAARPIIVITGILTANVQLIFPTYVKSWVISNNATGAFTVTCKTSAGGGIALVTGKTSQVYGDGTDIKALPNSINLARFTANGSFTVPAGVTTIWASGCAGGGGGAGTASTSTQVNAGGGGGGAGQSIIRVPFTVTPGQVIAITIGAAGAAGLAGAAGGNGGNTVIGSLVTLTFGGGGGPSSGATTGTSGGGGAGVGFPNGGTGNDQGGSGGGGGGGAGGAGASGPFGGGGGAAKSVGTTPAPGFSASGFGAGGGGCGGINAVVFSPANIGGAGAPGLVIIEW